jgi:hypothetical protein
MYFEIKSHKFLTVIPPDHERIIWSWTLRRGTEKNPGNVIAIAPQPFDTPAAARSDVAAFRTSVGSVKFAKVVVRDDSQ